MISLQFCFLFRSLLARDSSAFKSSSPAWGSRPATNYIALTPKFMDFLSIFSGNL